MELVARQPPRREIHIILDNLSAHKTARVHQFLADHPRVQLPEDKGRCSVDSASAPPQEPTEGTAQRPSIPAN